MNSPDLARLKHSPCESVIGKRCGVVNPQVAQSLLKYGPTGFAAIVILLAYYVIKAEQKRKGDPRPGIFRMFVILCGLGVALVAGPLWREYSEHEKSGLVSQITALTNAQVERSKQLESAVNSGAQFRREISERNYENKKLSDEVSRLRSELSATLERIAAQSDTASRIDKENQQSAQRVASLQKENETMSAQLVKHQETSVANQARVAELENSLTAAKNEIESLRSLTKETSRVRYSAEANLKVGLTFVDKLTGVSLGISSINRTFGGIMDGNIMFPSGVSQRIFSAEPGKAWRFLWNGRSFTIAISHGIALGDFKVTIQETTEPL